MLMLILLLQKPHSRSKTRKYVACLIHRLVSWNDGDIDSLREEGRAIQSRFRGMRWDGVNNNPQLRTRKFAKLMSVGKVKQALHLLSGGNTGGLLPLSHMVPSVSSQSAPQTVRDALIEKHPPGQEAHDDILLAPQLQDIPPVIFESIDGEAIRSAALRTEGAAGLSGLDSYFWRRLCSAFKSTSSELCTSLALVAHRICTSYVDPRCLAPLLASHLIALDKNPGVHPIGVGETSRHIMSKAVLSIMNFDIQEATGAFQLCAG